jgi:hypothetical protein
MPRGYGTRAEKVLDSTNFVCVLSKATRRQEGPSGIVRATPVPITRFMTVTFQTNCWQRDWRRMLETDRLQRMVEYNQYPFARKTLLINELEDYRAATLLAERAIERGWLTDYVIVEEHTNAALEFFELSRATLGRGYKYSIAELVGIYLCQSEFLLYFMGDCLPERSCPWIPPAMAMLERSPSVKVVNLTWDAKYAEAKKEALTETDEYYVGFGFSDQCYFIRTADFRAPIYNRTHQASARFPLYAGESFEKRVDSWMHCHGFQRATYKHGAYLHRNIPPPAGIRIKQVLSEVARSAASKIRSPKPPETDGNGLDLGPRLGG